MPSTAVPEVARASAADTARVAAAALVPLAARGAILRRPRVVALEARLDADHRTVALLQRLRARYGAGPLRLRIPGRSVALVLEPAHVERVLTGTPEPFAADTREKRAALGHFQPGGVLVSSGAERADRRRFNEAVLDADRPVHRLADRMTAVVDDEVGRLLDGLRGGVLTWDGFLPAWWRIVRRVVLGDGATDDEELTDQLQRLRADANWSYLRRRRDGLRAAFDRRLRAHLDRAEPGSLAQLVATVPSTATTAPAQQVPQWLFAFDAAGIVTASTLALLATHPHERTEAFLRAAVLDAVRLWPTTPAVLRDTTGVTEWDGGAVLPAGTALVVLTTFFSRDGERVAQADRFAPEAWLDGTADASWSLVPFSAGPARCPGRDLVLLLASTVLASVLRRADVELLPPVRLGPERPLPGTLDHPALRFAVTPR